MTTNQPHPANGAPGTTVPAYPYHYFVAIQYFNPAGGLAFTNMEIPLTKKLMFLEQVQDMERYLRRQGYTNALVMGFHLLRTDPAAQQRTTRPGGDGR